MKRNGGHYPICQMWVVLMVEPPKTKNAIKNIKHQFFLWDVSDIEYVRDSGLNGSYRGLK